jgi:hypothetical protein
MATRTLRILSPGGDTTLAEWDTETLTKPRRNEIENIYKDRLAQGATPVDITDKKDEIPVDRSFNPQADTLLIPRLQGGRE